MTHPQGVADLVGGHLTDPTGAIQYGAFIASQQGSYSLSLDWDQIYQSTQFQFVGQTQISFVAQFFDARAARRARRRRSRSRAAVRHGEPAARSAWTSRTTR